MGNVFKKILKVYDGIRVCMTKEPCRLVIVGAYYTSVHLQCACVCMSDGRISDDEFRLRRGGFSISSLSNGYLRHNSVILQGTL